MLTAYRPGQGRLHRMSAGVKTVLLLLLAIGILLLPSQWWSAGVAVGVTVAGYALAQLRDGLCGMRELGRQVRAMWWIIAFTLVSQLIFTGVEPAVANTARVTASLALAGLLVLTTRASDLLAVYERGLSPLRKVGVDPERIALLLMVTLSTIPALARAARDVQEAQRARGARPNLRTFAVPFLVVALSHADQLGDALTARGVR
ncbi:energy-coupling factor transporter transmembrane component T family protein [Microbacterium sp. bgisy189]|uniref:energy-coupling factor transporter transmembrane component T family protein n=1 Tax=Microbacterium sp. bgisy189 TaxID=3413798 RepID=UPI003EBED7DB